MSVGELVPASRYSLVPIGRVGQYYNMIRLRPQGPDEVRRQRWRLGMIAGATVIGLAEASEAYAAYHFNGFPASIGFVLIENLPWWYLWAALTPIIVWLVQKCPLDGPRWWRSVAVHVPAGIAIASIHLFVFCSYYYPVIAAGEFDSSFWGMVSRFFSSYAFNDMLTYWGIVLGCYVVIYYRRYRTSALETLQAEARAARLETGRVEASLNALRMELNPHFLFNTLNAVSGLIRRGETATAVTMLARLGDLLRTTLEQRDDLTVPLEDELTFLESYLAIERLRFEDRLTVEVDVPQDCRTAAVPPLILQPLVENAVRHGIARTPGPGTVIVRARRQDGDLLLEVRDSGRHHPTGNGSPPREGVGLSNTRARLQELYGPQASLVFMSEPDSDTVVRLVLPDNGRIVVQQLVVAGV